MFADQIKSSFLFVSPSHLVEVHQKCTHWPFDGLSDWVDFFANICIFKSYSDEIVFVSSFIND